MIKIPNGTIHRIIGLLQGALRLLKVDISSTEIERIGFMVHRAMSMQHRSFHTPEHIFALADPYDAHSTMAAIFHDIVYYQVDQGFQDDIEKILRPYILLDKNVIRIKAEIDGSDRAFYGTAAVFGFTPGQILSPFSGLNEFLSALLMNCLFEGRINDVDLLITTAMIEMTIPFRAADKSGRLPGDILKLKLQRTNEQFGLGLSDEQLNQTIVSAVILSNRDVNNFAEDDPAKFLDNTWKLLPESNPELLFKGLYTIRNYSTALMKMEGFLSHLKAETVFQQYDGYPEQSEYELLTKKTSTNLKIASSYLGIKMISAGILMALAELSGGDAPMSFFMGDVNSGDKKSCLTYYLPDCSVCSGDMKNENTVLYRLLKHGRSSSSDFDLQNSPLSLFIYCSLDEGDQKFSIDASRIFLKGECNLNTFLDAVPSRIITAIASAASFIAFSRRDRLLEISEFYRLH